MGGRLGDWNGDGTERYHCGLFLLTIPTIPWGGSARNALQSTPDDSTAKVCGDLRVMAID